MIDPVSQNPVPPGAMPKEVRDDVPIMASEGEFVVPADVVRFLGLEKLEGMVQKAKESLAQMKEGGRIGGKPLPQKQPPQSQPPSQPMGGPQRPPGMAQGGVVAPQTTGAVGASPIPQATMQAYVGPNGQIIYIPILNGSPIATVPQGFTPTQNPQQQTQNTGSRSSRRDTERQAPRGVDSWSVDDFVSYGTQLESGVPDVMRSVAGAVLPFSNILFGLAERNMQNTVPQMIDTMIENGVDAQGNPITEEQRAGLINTRNVMADRVSRETGVRFNPFESLGNFFNRAIGRGQGQTNSASNPTQNNRPSGPSSFETRSTSNMTQTPDKEEKSGGQKGFASGGLIQTEEIINNQPKPPLGMAPPSTRKQQFQGFLDKRTKPSKNV